MKLTVAGCGLIDSRMGEQNRDGCIRLPVTCSLIEVDGELVVWDTGMSEAVIADPVGHWGRVARRRLVPVLEQSQLLTSRLAKAGYGPDDVTLLVNSHLHWDHSGQNCRFPGAVTIVRERELAYAQEQAALGDGYCWDDIVQDAAPEMIEYETKYELRPNVMTLISTPGHTPGHQSLLVRFPSGRRFLLGGDAVYSMTELETGRVPAMGLNWDLDAARRSVDVLASYIDDGAELVVSHDQRWPDRLTTLHEE